MSVFSEHAKRSEPRKPPVTILLSPSAFADTWPGKPTSDVAVGLRFISEREIQTARAEAAKYAWQMHDIDADEEAREECFNDALMRWAVAYATCDPNDVTKPWLGDAGAVEDAIGEALHSSGIRRLWDAYDAMQSERGAVSPEADDDELREIAGYLTAGVVDRMTTAQGKRARKLLGTCLDTLRAVAAG